jgi:SAM-dependent methyltransferase
VPCGLGRHSIALATRGFRVTGLDVSPQAIAEARENARAAGQKVEFHVADMRDLSLRSEFDAAFCLGNSFGYVDASGTRHFVSALAGALRPGARLVVHTGMAAESVLPNLRDREWAQVGDMLFLEENVYHVPEGCYETRYTIVRDGESDTRSGLHWVFTVREIRDILASAGFRVVDAFSSHEGAPFEVGSRELLIVAQRV